MSRSGRPSSAGRCATRGTTARCCRWANDAGSSATDGPLVLTIGHSNRPFDAFVELLGENGVERIVDVRTMPRSRHNPQFNRDALAAGLPAASIGYTHVPELGGLRKPRADSPNGGWRNASFRGYADYMQTSAFAAALARVLELAADERCALMCAEAVPWRCHRSLIADALLVRGCRVEDIVGTGKRKRHALTPFARVDGLAITYPPSSTEADVPHEMG